MNICNQSFTSNRSEKIFLITKCKMLSGGEVIINTFGEYDQRVLQNYQFPYTQQNEIFKNLNFPQTPQQESYINLNIPQVQPMAYQQPGAQEPFLNLNTLQPQPIATQHQESLGQQVASCKDCKASGSKQRTRFSYTGEQLLELEKQFKLSAYASSERRSEISLNLKVPEYQIKIWFQNRRMKKKKTALKKVQTPLQTERKSKISHENLLGTTPLNNDNNFGKTTVTQEQCDTDNSLQTDTELSEMIEILLASNNNFGNETPTHDQYETSNDTSTCERIGSPNVIDSLISIYDEYLSSLNNFSADASCNTTFSFNEYDTQPQNVDKPLEANLPTDLVSFVLNFTVDEDEY